MKHLYSILMLLAMILFSSFEADAEREYHKRVGTSGFGVSTRKITCQYCGKEIYASDSHTCWTEKPSSSSSSSSSTDYEVTQSDIYELEAAYPDLKVNDTYIKPVDYSSGPSNNSSSGEYDSKASEVLHTYEFESEEETSHWFRNTLIVLAILLLLYFVYKQLKKSGKKTATPLNTEIQHDAITGEGIPTDTETSKDKQSPVETVTTAVSGEQPYTPTIPVTENEAARPEAEQPTFKTMSSPQQEQCSQSNTQANSQSNKPSISTRLTALRNNLQEANQKASKLLQEAMNSETVQQSKSKFKEKVQQVKNHKVTQDAKAKIQEGWDKARSKTADAVSKYRAKNTSGTISIADELTKLHELKKAGILTEEEFTAMKEKLMSNK